ncbi:MAG: hypothetical protein VKP72_04130 [bacterium]|nr:hypothetical protein [bacterium]
MALRRTSEYPLSPVETLDAAKLRSLRVRKLRELLAIARAGSPYYADRLAAFDLASLVSPEGLPVLDRHALRAHVPPNGSDLLTGPLEAAYVFRSGGTTGSPKFSAFSRDEFRRIVPIFQRTYGAAGLHAGDHVANLFVSGSLYASFVFVNRMLEEMGCVNYPFTHHAPAETVNRHVGWFPINTLVGITSGVLAAVAGLEETSASRIEKVFYGGEHLHDDERVWLRERLPNLRLLASAGYGAVDTGILGFQCTYATGAVHHLHADHVWLEIVDPETFAPVADGDEGTVLVTMLDRTLMPLLRYDLGDRARWIEGACPCGRNSPRFELLGRQDDLRIGIATVAHDEVVQAATSVRGLTSRLQMIKEREDRRDRLVVRVELLESLPAGARDQLVVALDAALRRVKPDLGTLVDTGHIHPLVLELLEPGSVPRSPVTGKVIRTRDLTLEA